ncbi:MAG: mechanosensitive ion channel [Candidatus Dependentiae bacterium]|jgi:small-conductance mechanosensitive channel
MHIAAASLFSLCYLAVILLTSRKLYALLFHLFLDQNEGLDADEQPYVNRFEHAKMYYILSSIALFAFMLSIALFGVLRLFNATISYGTILYKLFCQWGIPLGTTGEVIGLNDLAIFLVFIVSGFVASGLLRNIILHRFFAVFYAQESSQIIIKRLIHYATILAAFVLGLNAIQLGGYAWQLVLVSSFGIAVGMKDIVFDLFAGLWLLFERNIQPGHFVEGSSFSGVIEDITIRTTTIRTLDGAPLVVPNRQIITKEVKAWGREQRGIRVEYPITLSLPLQKKSIDEHIDAIHEVLRHNEHVYSPPRSAVYISKANEKEVTFAVQIYIKQQKNTDPARVLSDVKKAFLNNS